MGRRAAKEEGQFGHDSFLDVVTNMVGILIILIVIAGLKVSKAPLPPHRLQTSADDEIAAAEPIAPQDPEPPAPAKLLPLPQPDPEPRVIPPSPELVSKARQIDAELQQATAEQRRLQAELERAAEEERALQSRRQAARQALAAEAEQLKQSREQLGRVRGTLDQTEAMLAELKHAVEEAENEPGPVKQLKHRLNPVSSLVDGAELHFRLAKNRVAPIPIEELVERVKPQIEQKKNWLLKNRVHQGQVGPVDGFVMNYVVEARPLSVIEEMRQGRGMVRIGLAEWQIAPEPDLEAETADQALRAGSKFLRAVRAAPRDATLTFWVYPDSFELYRRLKEFAHDEDFTVAARPLPFGVPIAGSPRGSRSAGQ